ncbi:MAG: hypothetical protein Q7S32_03245 [bacterium]|nr:hypothetical protein [bacterium]
MIGLSVSFCIREIAEGRVDLSKVDKIVAGTVAVPDQIDRLVTAYNESYWRRFPEAEKIFRDLYAAGKIEQPRLKDDQHFPMIAGGHWVESEDQIVWSDDPSRNTWRK